jgi:hypothetical protein
MQLKEKLDDLDIELIYLEDRLHGEEGNRITRARKILEDISNQVDKPVKPANGGLEEILKDWAKQFEFNYIPITAKKIIEDRKNLIITMPENLIFALLHATKFEIKEDSRLSA